MEAYRYGVKELPAAGGVGDEAGVHVNPLGPRWVPLEVHWRIKVLE